MTELKATSPFIVTPGPGSLALSWTVPPGAYMGVPQWRVHGPGAWTIGPLSYNAYTITGLTSVENYDVRVVFLPAGGVTNTVTATPKTVTPPPPPPPAPTPISQPVITINPPGPLTPPQIREALMQIANAVDSGTKLDATDEVKFPGAKSEQLWLVTVQAGDSYWFVDFAVSGAATKQEAIAVAQQSCNSLRIEYPEVSLKALSARKP